jgi:hypothetical protein
MRLILSILALLSMFHLSAISHRHQDDLYMTGAIIVGAIAGAGTGYAVQSLKGPKLVKIAGPAGEQGAKGSRGEAGQDGLDAQGCFTVDEGASLSFKYSIVTEKAADNGTMLIPFVSYPNGVTSHLSAVHIGGELHAELGAILVDNPVMGTYHVGVLLFTKGAGFDQQVLNLIVEATASRNDRSVTTILEQTEIVEFNPVDQTQITAEYTYSHDLL